LITAQRFYKTMTQPLTERSKAKLNFNDAPAETRLLDDSCIRFS
jgi:hypothetical protein